MSTGRLVLLIIVASALVRVWLAAIAGLGYDESYMVGNARQLMVGYVDQAPMHLWIAWAAQTVFQSDAAVLVRLPFIVLFAGSTWLMYRLTGRLFGPAAGLWAVIAFNLAPVFSVAHASWVLADGPLIFFLLAAANLVARALFEETRPGPLLLTWVAAGAFGGLAMLSKYNAAFFFLAVFVYLLTVPAARRQLATPGPWLGVLAALVAFSPVIAWNAEYGLVGLLFQSKRVANPTIGVGWLAVEVAGQMLYLTPWLYFPLAISLIAALRKGRRDARGWLLGLAAIGPIVAFTLVTLFARGLPHWSMPGWLFAFPLFGRDAVALAVRRPRFARGYMTAVAGIFALLIAAFAFQATRGGLVPRAVIAENPSVDPTIDLIDWSELSDALQARGLAGPDLVAASPAWLYAGKVSYALGPRVPVVCLCEDAQHFAFRHDQSQWAGRDVVVVVPRMRGGLWDSARRFFDGFEDLGAVAITRGGETVLTLDLRLGKNLQFR